MKEILADERKGYCILLSGQDYPIKNNVYLNLYLQFHKGTNFINGTCLPKAEWANGGLDRVSRYYFHLSDNNPLSISIPSVFDRSFWKSYSTNIKKVLILLKNGKIPLRILRTRKSPNQLTPFGGSQWWALPIETIEKIMEYVACHPEYLKFHEYTHIPDEIFFQTIIFSIIPSKNIKPSLTYVEWNGTSASPITFKTNDFRKLRDIGNQFIFARKFSEITDKVILDLIDVRLLQTRITPKEVQFEQTKVQSNEYISSHEE